MVFGLNEISDVVQAFWRKYSGKKIFAFHGPLGAGKTTFIHSLCEFLQVDQTVGSPTFSIINEYSYSGGRIFHIDLFRVNDEDEAIRSGVEDCLYSGDICLVEWPEKAAGIFPPETVHISIYTVDPQTRRIREEAYS